MRSGRDFLLQQEIKFGAILLTLKPASASKLDNFAATAMMIMMSQTVILATQDSQRRAVLALSHRLQERSLLPEKTT